MCFVLLLHFSNLNTKFAAERRRGQVQTFYSIQSEANSSLGNLSQLKKNYVAEKKIQTRGRMEYDGNRNRENGVFSTDDLAGFRMTGCHRR